MIEVEDMSLRDAQSLLAELDFGHLGCAEASQPYVVPIHFVYRDERLFIYTTDGKKSRIIERNSKVCLQAEDVVSNEDWRSVIVLGNAFPVKDEYERRQAIAMLSAVNPSMTPAVSVRWMDSWVKENIEIIYRIEPTQITGRSTVERTRSSSPFASRPGEPNIN